MTISFSVVLFAYKPPCLGCLTVCRNAFIYTYGRNHCVHICNIYELTFNNHSIVLVDDGSFLRVVILAM